MTKDEAAKQAKQLIRDYYEAVITPVPITLQDYTALRKELEGQESVVINPEQKNIRAHLDDLPEGLSPELEISMVPEDNGPAKKKSAFEILKGAADIWN